MHEELSGVDRCALAEVVLEVVTTDRLDPFDDDIFTEVARAADKRQVVDRLLDVAADAQAPIERRAVAWNLAMHVDNAHDLTFSGAELPKGFVGNIARLMERHGCTIARHKTRVRTRADRQLVTGLVVNERPRPPRDSLRWLRSALHRIESGRDETSQPAVFGAPSTAGSPGIRTDPRSPGVHQAQPDG